jgi:hypothetical protein
MTCTIGARSRSCHVLQCNEDEDEDEDDDDDEEEEEEDEDEDEEEEDKDEAADETEEAGRSGKLLIKRQTTGCCTN